MVDSLFNRSTERDNTLKRLYDLAIAPSGDLAEVGKKVAEAVAELLHVPFAAVEALESDKVRMIGLYARGETTTGNEAVLHGTACEQVVRLKQPYYTSSAHERFPNSPFLQEYRIATYAGVPVFDKSGEVIGVINAMSDDDIALTSESFDLLHILAQRVSAEMQIAGLLDRERHHARHLSTILDIVRTINSEIEYKEVLKRIARATLEVTGSDRCNILLFDKPQQQLVPTITLSKIEDRAGWEDFKREAALSIDTIPEIYSLLSHRDVVTFDSAAESSLLPPHLIQRYQVKSLGLALLRSADGESLGIMTLDYHSAPHQFSQAEIELLKAIAHESVIAITNAQLYQSSREAEERYRAAYLTTEIQLRQLRALEKVNEDLTLALDLQQIFRSVIEASRAILDADRSGLYLINHATGLMECAYASGVSEAYTEAAGGYCPWERGSPQKPKPVAIADAASDPSLSQLSHLLINEGIRSLLLVPLVYRGELLGKLALYHNENKVYSTHEIELAQAFANQAAIAINNARLYEHLKASEERHVDLYERAPAMYHTTDLRGIILDCNQTEVEMLGFSKSEIIGHSIEEFLPADSAGLLAESWPKLLSEGRIEGLEFQLRQQDGTLLSVVCDASTINDAHGTPVAIRSILRDITERKRLEEQLLRSQRMEAVGTLASGIAHDFNNLLTGVLGFASLGKTLTQPEEEIYEHLDMIEKSAIRASDLTRQLLTFVRGGKRQAKAVNVNETIRETLQLLMRGIDKKVVVEQSLAPDLPVIEADPAQIQQALLNLCINSCEAMPIGGTLMIKTNSAFIEDPYAHQLPDAKPGYYIIISVTDTGIGMDQATQARIFDPFFTTKELGKGTGLGLAMVYGIVRNHDGFINVYSELGHGSTFKVYLPVRTAGEESAVIERATKLRGGNETVLVIDDEPHVRRLASQVLRTLGYQVLVAEDGQHGVEVFRQHDHDIALVILDLTMPRMGGLETFRSLKAINPDVKVILSSGYTQEGKAAKLLTEGVQAFVQKPYQMQELATTVRKILDGEEL
jgi:PAS domain S-box-containing protein